MSYLNESQNSNQFNSDLEIKNLREISENEEPSVIQEACEHINVEIVLPTNPDCNCNINNDSEKIIGNIVQISSDNCLSCNSKIYPMEKLAVDGKLYHKNCFRCAKCRTILSVTNFNLSNNLIYCKTHFMELFKIRGKYDDNITIEHEIVLQNEKDVEEIITTDTKGLLEKFRKMETGSAPLPCSNERQVNTTRYVQHGDDIVRSHDVQQDELPAPETAKAMVAKFKAMETDKNIPTPEQVQKMQFKAKANLQSNPNIRLQTNTTQCQQIPDDFNVTEQLPEEGTTRNLLSKFQNLSNSSQP